MTNAGLTISDKPALLDAKARGAEWIACDKQDVTWIYKEQPYKGFSQWMAMAIDSIPNLPYCRWRDTEPVNIDLALAQIAEMESAEKPMTNGEKILERYANSIRRFASSRVHGIQANGKLRYYRVGIDKGYNSLAEALSDEEAFLASPYTEGEKV